MNNNNNNTCILYISTAQSQELLLLSQTQAQLCGDAMFIDTYMHMHTQTTTQFESEYTTLTLESCLHCITLWLETTLCLGFPGLVVT